MNTMEGAQGSRLDSVLKTRMPALGIDLGGTKISAALVCDSKLVSEPRQVPTPRGADKILEALIGLIAEFKESELIAAVGIATAGIVRVDTGEVVGSTGNLPGWEGTAIKKIIEQRTALPVHVENDANAAAYGDCRACGLETKECIITVTLGTGIGGGIVLRGRLYRGAHWAAGEIGHIRIATDNKRMCTCGLWDCWEAYASGRGMRATGEEIFVPVQPEQSELAQYRGHLTNEMIQQAAQAGDLIAQKVLSLWHDHVSFGLATLAHAFDPDYFFISGGMTKFVDFELLRELVADRTLPRIGEKLEIRPSALGTAAGIVGAGQLALDSITASV